MHATDYKTVSSIELSHYLQPWIFRLREYVICYREQWKTTIPPYQPVFMDGWSPDYQVDDQPLRRYELNILFHHLLPLWPFAYCCDRVLSVVVWCNVRASPRGEAGRGAPAREARETREVREPREARDTRGPPERAAPPPAVFAYDRDEPDLYPEQYSPYVRYPASHHVTCRALVALINNPITIRSLYWNYSIMACY